jgi:hypothetical protein
MPAALTGGCLCGAVRFELTDAPTAAVYCHCTRCQRRTGTAAAPNFRVVPGSVRVTAGEVLVKAWHPPGGGAPKCFCTECGGALWSLAVSGDIGGVRRAALDEDPGTPFTHRQFTDFAASWEPIPDDGLPRYGGAPPS